MVECNSKRGQIYFLVDGLILEKSEKVWNGNKRVVPFSAKSSGKGEG
jgi:hypothetical protein